MQLTFYNGKKTLVFRSLLFLFAVGFLTACQKEISLQKTEIISVDKIDNAHKEKIETWFRLIPIRGKFTDIDFSKIRTVSINGQLTTRIVIGTAGNSFYFVSNKDKFHVYGINSLNLKKDNSCSGIVDIYDFQTLSKKSIKYEKGKVAGIIKYRDNDPIINAYNNYYPKSFYNTNENNARITSDESLIRGIRKFFCELFGGTWHNDVAGNATNPGGSCSTGGNGSDEVQEMMPPEAGANYDLGLIWQNLNSPSYFDPASSVWNNIPVGLSGGGGNLNWAISSTGNLDPYFENPDKIRSLYFILNTQYNQQPATPFDGTLDEIFNNFSNYSNAGQVPIPIIVWILKAGANGAADALTQALFIYLTEDNCPSFGAAFGHSKFSKLQVARSVLEGLIPWRTPGGKIGRAAVSAVGDVLVNMVEGKYGISDYYTLGADFMLGFFSDFAGGELGELASRYSIPKIGKGLITKFGVLYRTATVWLGGGLQAISKTFTHSAAHGGTITANRIMKGWAIGKIAVVGRNVEQRVKPFASQLSGEFGSPVLTW